MAKSRAELDEEIADLKKKLAHANKKLGDPLLSSTAYSAALMARMALQTKLTLAENARRKLGKS